MTRLFRDGLVVLLLTIALFAGCTNESYQGSTDQQTSDDDELIFQAQEWFTSYKGKADHKRINKRVGKVQWNKAQVKYLENKQYYVVLAPIRKRSLGSNTYRNAVVQINEHKTAGHILEYRNDNTSNSMVKSGTSRIFTKRGILVKSTIFSNGRIVQMVDRRKSSPLKVARKNRIELDEVCVGNCDDDENDGDDDCFDDCECFGIGCGDDEEDYDDDDCLNDCECYGDCNDDNDNDNDCYDCDVSGTGGIDNVSGGPAFTSNGVLDKMHIALDLAGLVPGLGEIADGLNAIIYLAEGDKTNAALSAVAMLPLVGWAATATRGGSRIWTATKQRSAVKNAYEHWKKHGPEFPELNNSKQYVEKVIDFMHNRQPGELTSIRSNGDLLKYQESTNIFGIIRNDGIPRTLFKPTEGINYWNRVK